MILPLTFMLLSALFGPTCKPTAPGETLAIPTEQAAVTAAKAAWYGKFSTSAVEEYEPYRAKLEDGVWHVFGSLPPGWRGGTLEAVICASDGKVLKVFHSR
ncbi:MAG: hypothetical protein H7Y32_17080 [Chloroflexales bacterium]|nr:hypothetical protein [Chloroflexales bacterium]